jgi:multidrug resistance protein, MATE family
MTFQLLGTREVSAFVTVRTLIDISSSFFGGFHESIATLCSQALGRHNYKLVGQYVQLSMIFYVIAYIPFIIIWWKFMPSLLLTLGFDAETAEIGKEYTKVYLFLELIDGVDEAIHALLDVTDLESYSTLVGVSQELVTFFDILFCALFAKPSLFVVGLIELFVALIFIGINVTTIIWRGWFEPYKEGLIGGCALHNKAAARRMMGTASSLSFGYLLTDGEWEILTLFASVLGPAEVAAWGILGVLWDAVEQLTEAVADASEVRCAFLLGSGQPFKAKRSAYKSIFLGVFLSLFLTSIVFMMGDNIATLFTNDPALQHIIKDLIPLFGIGNMTLTVGTMCWTLLGSQGRYRLATFVAFIASWFVTLPLAALFTFHLRINLQGQTAAVVIGFMVSGTINAYFLFRSDWEALSRSVQKANESGETAPPDLDELAAMHLDCHCILPNPTSATLGTLTEAKSGEVSFSSSEDGLTPNSTPEKEIV